MDLEQIKAWSYDNRKGLIVGAILGFVVSRLLK